MFWGHLLSVTTYSVMHGHSVKALHFAGIVFCGFPVNVCSLEFNFEDLSGYIVTMHCWNVHVVFNLAETVHSQNSRNKSHTKFKAFTVLFHIKSYIRPQIKKVVILVTLIFLRSLCGYVWIKYIWFKYKLDRSTTHSKFNLTGVQTHDLQTGPPNHDSTYHVTVTPALTTQPLVNSLRYSPLRMGLFIKYFRIRHNKNKLITMYPPSL